MSRSSLPTSSMTNVCLVGISSVLMMPSPIAQTRMCQYCTWFSHTNTAKMKVIPSDADCVNTRSFFFENRSMMTPENSENRKTGTNCMAETKPTKKDEFVRLKAKSGWATFCIHVPINEKHMPAVYSAKFRCLSAESGLDRFLFFFSIIIAPIYQFLRLPNRAANFTIGFFPHSPRYMSAPEIWINTLFDYGVGLYHRH